MNLESPWPGHWAEDCEGEWRRPDPLKAQDSSEALIRRWRQGDDGAFRQLYDQHRSSVLRFLRRMLRTPADAEEVAQEVWLSFVNGKAVFRGESRFRTFLFGIAHRRASDHWRRIGRSLGTPEPAEVDMDTIAAPEAELPDRQLETGRRTAALIAAVQALPLAQREVFLLRAEGDLTIDEMAQVLATGRETVKSRLRYALDRLRSAMEGWL